MKKKVFRVIAIMVLVIAALLVGVHIFLNSTYRNLTSLDDMGRLYSIEYKADYYNPLIRLPIKFISPVKNAGCTTFTAKTAEGSYLTGRNYDLNHRDNQGNQTGLNVIIHSAIAGKYESIAVADAAWISTIKIPYYAYAFDKWNVPNDLIAFLPYMCMDGMNEKGLVVSILALDIKEGEAPVYQQENGKEQLLLTELLRYLLDNCASFDEAVEFTKGVNVINTLGYDFHLFVSDSSGEYGVFEFRNNYFTVTKSDIATNFYVGYDDGDYSATEKYRNELEGYKLGYGHGYDRFYLAAVTRNAKRNSAGEVIMSEQETKELLDAVAQKGTDEITSFTQYSAVYNQTEKKMYLYANQNYDKCYYNEPFSKQADKER